MDYLSMEWQVIEIAIEEGANINWFEYMRKKLLEEAMEIIENFWVWKTWRWGRHLWIWTRSSGGVSQEDRSQNIERFKDQEPTNLH